VVRVLSRGSFFDFAVDAAALALFAGGGLGALDHLDFALHGELFCLVVDRLLDVHVSIGVGWGGLVRRGQEACVGDYCLDSLEDLVVGQVRGRREECRPGYIVFEGLGDLADALRVLHLEAFRHASPDQRKLLQERRADLLGQGRTRLSQRLSVELVLGEGRDCDEVAERLRCESLELFRGLLGLCGFFCGDCLFGRGVGRGIFVFIIFLAEGFVVLLEDMVEVPDLLCSFCFGGDGFSLLFVQLGRRGFLDSLDLQQSLAEVSLLFVDVFGEEVVQLDRWLFLSFLGFLGFLVVGVGRCGCFWWHLA